MQKVSMTSSVFDREIITELKLIECKKANNGNINDNWRLTLNMNITTEEIIVELMNLLCTTTTLR